MLLRGRGAAWAALLAALRQRRRLHGLLSPRQGALAIRARAPGRSLQELTSLSPADLREGRAPASDAQALSGKAGAGQDACRAAGAAGCLRALLQRHPPAYGPLRAHTAAGLLGDRKSTRLNSSH